MFVKKLQYHLKCKVMVHKQGECFLSIMKTCNCYEDLSMNNKIILTYF